MPRGSIWFKKSAINQIPDGFGVTDNRFAASLVLTALTEFSFVLMRLEWA